MKKVLYAIGHEDTENALTEEVKSEYEVVGTVIYKEALIGHLEQTRPDIVILREGLPGSLPILDLTYTIRAQMPDIRIIFIAEEKLPGDSLLAALVSFGIYDILASDKIRLSEIVDCIRRPRTLGEAAMFQTPFSGAQHGKTFRATPKTVQPEKKKLLKLFGNKGDKANKDSGSGVSKEINKALKDKERMLKEKEAEIERLKQQELEKIARLKQEELAEIERRKREIEEKAKSIPIPPPASSSSHTQNQQDVNSSKTASAEQLSSKNDLPDEAGATMEPKRAKQSTTIQKAPQLPTKERGDCQVIAFMGSKHGVGNTTIALNTAGVLAAKYKVLFIEINERYPVTSYLFEFDNVSTGLEMAAKMAKSGKGDKIEEMIERPKKNQAPSNLHFLPFSNSVLIAEKENRNEVLDLEGLRAIISYILDKGYYEYIIIDIQPDDRYVGEGVLDGRLIVDHLFITVTQDAHSIGCAVYKKHQLASRASFMLESLSFAVNMYNDKSQMLLPQIADGLEIDKSSLVPIVLDHAQLIDSSLNGEIYAKGSRGEVFLSLINKM